MEQCPNFPHSHPQDSYNCPTMFSLKVCLKHWILGIVKGTTLRQLLANVLECDHHDASSDVQQNGHHLVRSLGCVEDARDTPIQKVTVRLPSVGLYGNLTKQPFFCRPSGDASGWFLVNDQRDAKIPFYIFIFIYNSLRFSSTSCSSSGETNYVNTSSGNCHSMSVAVSFAGWEWTSGWLQTPNIVEVPAGAWEQFLSQSTKFCAKGIH